MSRTFLPEEFKTVSDISELRNLVPIGSDHVVFVETQDENGNLSGGTLYRWKPGNTTDSSLNDLIEPNLSEYASSGGSEGRW